MTLFHDLLIDHCSINLSVAHRCVSLIRHCDYQSPIGERHGDELSGIARSSRRSRCARLGRLIVARNSTLAAVIAIPNLARIRFLRISVAGTVFPLSFRIFPFVTVPFLLCSVLETRPRNRAENHHRVHVVPAISRAVGFRAPTIFWVPRDACGRSP